MKKFVKENLNLFIKGLIIGGAVIIPGISGGTMAILLGVYDDMITSIASFRTNFKKSFFFLLPLIVGIVFSFVLLVIPLDLAFKYFPFPLIGLFGGLILGGVGPLLQKIKGPRNAGNILTLILTFLFAGSLGILSVYFKLDSSFIVNNFSFWHALIMIGVGFLVVSSQLIPGISATLLLLVLGFYQALIGIMKDVLSALFSGGLSAQGGNIATIAVLMLGALLGFFIFSHLVKFLLTKYHRGFYHGVVGFVFGSLISLFYNLDLKEHVYQSIAPWQLGLGIGLFIIGIAAGFYLTKFGEKIENKAKEKHCDELGT